jgi:choline-sulfatase
MTRRRALFGALAIAATGVLIFVAVRREKPAAPASRNLLIITLDTVRADRLGAFGYVGARTPQLDALARNGVMFADATAQAPITGPSHAAIFTGLYPARLGVRDNATTPLPDDARTLAEILSERGYATGGFIGAFILDRPYGFAQGFAAFDGGFTRVEPGEEANVQRRGDAVVEAALRWLGSLPAGRPFLLWVHLYDAHAAYEPPEPFATEFAASPYDGEIAFVDTQVGRLVDALRARPDFDRTVIMAVGDHGEALGGHGEDEHGVFLYDEVLRVPWIVFGPGAKRGHAVTEQVRTIDLFPTALDLLRIDPPGTIDGESLGMLLQGGTRPSIPPSYSETHYPKLHYGWSELRSIRADGWKAVDAPKRELYNLRSDPSEQHNLYEPQRALADRMVAEAGRLSRELAPAASTGAGQTPPQPDRETLDRLRSLGYVGVAAPLAPGARGADPKDMIARRKDYRAQLSEAIGDLRGGRPADAAVKLQRLIRANGRAYDLHQFLGEAYEKQGQLEQALGEYEMAALLNPTATAPLLSAAEVHLSRRDVPAARKRLDEAARLDPRSFDVALVTGRVREAEARVADALAAYEKAVAINPANPRSRTLLVGVATQLGRYDVAETQLRQLLAMEYRPSRTHFALGRLAHMRGLTNDAAVHYREALRLEPGLTMAEEGLRRLGQR